MSATHARKKPFLRLATAAVAMVAALGMAACSGGAASSSSSSSGSSKSVSVLTAKQDENPPNSGLRLVKTSFPFF